MIIDWSAVPGFGGLSAVSSAMHGPAQTWLSLLESWRILREAMVSVYSPVSGRDIAGSVTLEWQLPWMLVALPLPFLVYWLVKYRQPAAAALLLPAAVNIAVSDQTEYVRSRRWLLLAALLIWALLVVASARPLWFGPPVSSPQSGRDLLMAIDISGSMRESDLYYGNQSYTRISVVREVASSFVEQRSGDRIGLIMFGTQAYVQTPLTFDHQTVAHFIREAEVGLAGRSTAIGDAIGLGVKRLRERPVDSRVMLLLTDGANSAGTVDPVEAATVARQNDIRIHTIGVGAEARQTLFGFPARASELDEKTLLKIAEVTGGQYFRARNVDELQRVYQLIDELEPTESEENQFREQRELFIWPLGIALLGGLLLMWRRLHREISGF